MHLICEGLPPRKRQPIAARFVDGLLEFVIHGFHPSTRVCLEEIVLLLCPIIYFGSAGVMALGLLYGALFYERPDPLIPERELSVLRTDWHENFLNLSAIYPTSGIQGKQLPGFKVGEFSSKHIRVCDSELYYHCRLSSANAMELRSFQKDAIGIADNTPGFNIPLQVKPFQIPASIRLGLNFMEVGHYHSGFGLPSGSMSDIDPTSLDLYGLHAVPILATIPNAGEAQGRTTEVGLDLVSAGFSSREDCPDSSDNTAQHQADREEVLVVGNPFKHSGFSLPGAVFDSGLRACVGPLLYRKGPKNASTSGKGSQL